MNLPEKLRCLALYCALLSISTCDSRTTSSDEEENGRFSILSRQTRTSKNLKYIPLRYGDYHESFDFEDDPTETTTPYPMLSAYLPPDLVMTLLKTAYEVVTNINKNKPQKKVSKLQAIEKHKYETVKNESPKKVFIRKKEDTRTLQNKIIEKDESDETGEEANNNNEAALDKSEEDEQDGRDDHDVERGRGMYGDDYEYHDHDHGMITTTTPKPKEMKPRYSDPWAGYYDFLINEGSFKFWSAFQLATVALLLYSAFAAIYYAKFNPVTPDYDTEYDDYFFGRSARSVRSANPDSRRSRPAGNQIRSSTFQRIMDAISKEAL